MDELKAMPESAEYIERREELKQLEKEELIEMLMCAETARDTYKERVESTLKMYREQSDQIEKFVKQVDTDMNEIVQTTAAYVNHMARITKERSGK